MCVAMRVNFSVRKSTSEKQMSLTERHYWLLIISVYSERGYSAPASRRSNIEGAMTQWEDLYNGLIPTAGAMI